MMRHFLILCIICGLLVPSSSMRLSAQRRTIDSLTAILSTAPFDTVRVRTLNKLCWHLRFADYVASVQYGLQALELAEKLHYQAGTLEALNFIGIAYRNTELYPSALEYFRRAADEALRQNNIRQRAFAFNNIGDVYKSQQQYDSAQAYIRQALTIFSDLKDVEGMEYALVRMGETALGRGDTARALDFYKHRKILVGELRPSKLPDAWIALLGAYFHARQDSNLIRSFPEALPLLKGTEHERAAYILLAKVYSRMGDTARAEKLFTEAMRNDKPGNLIGNSMYEVASWMADAAARHGDFTKAYQYRTQAQIALESAQKASDMRAIAQAQMRYEATKRLEESLVFAKEQQQQRFVIAAISVALCFALALGVLLVRSNRRKERDNERIHVINRIGSEIAASLVFKDVVLTIHHEINKLMDAPIFNIGVYLPEEERIEFRYLIEHGEFVPPPSVLMSDKERPAVQCLEQRREIVINDKEIPLLVGAQPKSLVYVPLIANDRVIGVFSVQSLVKNSYSPESVELLRAISSHIATAMENVHAFERIGEQNVALEIEREKSERLLLNVLPPAIAERMKHDQSRIAEHFDAVSVMFVDIVGFTTFSQHIGADNLVEMLDDMFSEFDAVMERYGLEKIKTIGDAYMAASGIPTPRADHLEAMARAALEIIVLEGRRVRIGIHTGSVVAGVIGTKKFAYDLWGDTVNTASRMESHGKAGKIHVSPEVYAALHDKFTFEERGEIEVKGKGMMRTWFLTGIASFDHASA